MSARAYLADWLVMNVRFVGKVRSEATQTRRGLALPSLQTPIEPQHRRQEGMIDGAETLRG